ncbi:hypothetical protein PAMA_008836 [Pampus argenteus]
MNGTSDVPPISVHPAQQGSIITLFLAGRTHPRFVPDIVLQAEHTLFHHIMLWLSDNGAFVWISKHPNHASCISRPGGHGQVEIAGVPKQHRAHFLKSFRSLRYDSTPTALMDGYKVCMKFAGGSSSRKRSERIFGWKKDP